MRSFSHTVTKFSKRQREEHQIEFSDAEIYSIYLLVILLTSHTSLNLNKTNILDPFYFKVFSHRKTRCFYFESYKFIKLILSFQTFIIDLFFFFFLFYGRHNILLQFDILSIDQSKCITYCDLLNQFR